MAKFESIRLWTGDTADHVGAVPARTIDALRRGLGTRRVRVETGGPGRRVDGPPPERTGPADRDASTRPVTASEPESAQEPGVDIRKPDRRVPDPAAAAASAAAAAARAIASADLAAAAAAESSRARTLRRAGRRTYAGRAAPASENGSRLRERGTSPQRLGEAPRKRSGLTKRRELVGGLGEPLRFGDRRGKMQQAGRGLERDGEGKAKLFPSRVRGLYSQRSRVGTKQPQSMRTDQGMSTHQSVRPPDGPLRSSR